MKPSQYDSDFAEAMALKLKLNRQMRLRVKKSSHEVANLPKAEETRMRDSLVDQILEDRPGLSREKLCNQMAEFGF